MCNHYIVYLELIYVVCQYIKLKKNKIYLNICLFLMHIRKSVTSTSSYDFTDFLELDETEVK